MMILMALTLSLLAQDAGGAAPPGKNKKICKTMRVTGSRVATRRVCQTASELRRQNSTDELERQRDLHAAEHGAQTHP